MIDKFSLGGDKFDYVFSVFFTRTSGRAYFTTLKQKDGVTVYTLSENGMSAAVDYLELKLAQERADDAKTSAIKAQKLALWSIGIGIIVGLAEIVIQLCN